MSHWLKQLINPKVLLPLIIVAGAIALLFGFGDPKKIVSEMASFNRTDLIWIFLLSVIYELVRFIQWLFLLRAQGVKAPVRAQIFSFAGGEATRFIPVGNYFQNYLLSTAEGVDFAYTSAATTLIILYEVVVSLAGVLLLGLGGLWWIRIVVVVGVLLAGSVGWLVYRLHGNGEPPAWIVRRDRLHRLWGAARDQLASFGKGAQRIIHPRTVAFSLVLATIYLIAAGGVLYVALEGIGWTQTAFGAVMAVYFFSLAIGLIFPLPVDIGVTEISGVGAFLAVGVERNAAISAMLINRVLTLGFSIVIFLIVAIIMRDETKRAWNARGARGQQRPRQSDYQGTPHPSTLAPDGNRVAVQHVHSTFDTPRVSLTAGADSPTPGVVRFRHDSDEMTDDQPRGAAHA